MDLQSCIDNKTLLECKVHTQTRLLLGWHPSGVFGEEEEEEGEGEELEEEAHFLVEELATVFLPNALKSDGLYFLQKEE